MAERQEHSPGAFYLNVPGVFVAWVCSIQLEHTTGVSSAAANFVHRHGAQGSLDSASKMSLAAEFDTENTDEAIIKILEQGTMQTMEVCLHSQIHPTRLFFRVLMIMFRCRVGKDLRMTL